MVSGAPDAEALPAWSDARLPEAPEAMRDVSLRQLERFLSHPVRYLVNSRLGVYLQEDEPEEDEEPFVLDGLQRFLLRQRLVEDHLRERAVTPRRLRAEGALPHGPFGELVLARETETLDPLLERLEPYRGRPPQSVAVDLPVPAGQGARRLSGLVPGLYPGLGLLRWRPGGLRGADILSLWAAHLAWCAAGGPGEKCSSLHTPEDAFVIREALAPGEARAALGRYLRWYWEGVHRPLPVLPKASYAYARQTGKGGGADPLKAARTAWVGSPYNGIPGDRDDAYVRLAMRGTAADPLESAEFEVLAGELYDEVLRCGEAP
jgi:exodeoxyribonuclease V gamma subunit